MSEKPNICEYDYGRFSLNEDGAIIDELEEFPPILICPTNTDDGSEPNCADKKGVLHLLNELSDNNPNENKHWYLRYMLNNCWGKRSHLQNQVDILDNENERLEDKLNKQEEMIKQLIEYKYLVKAVECVVDKPIVELISDWSEGEYFTYEQQLKLGKECSENRENME